MSKKFTATLEVRADPSAATPSRTVPAEGDTIEEFKRELANAADQLVASPGAFVIGASTLGGGDTV